MAIIVGNEQEKSQLLITEICEISTRAKACVRLHHPYSNRLPLIDWYLVLRVNENAELDAIRKQYHKLALQLHPDKNKHSNAETAFKLVSEAYFCLSDAARRAAFDTERKSNCCRECKINPSFNYHNHNNNTNLVKMQTPNQETSSRLSRIRRRMKELRTKLEEEATIIEKCLVTSTARSEVVSNKSCTRLTELPVFNPSDYHPNKGYPRQRMAINRDGLRADFILGSRFVHNPTKKDSPVFEFRSERVSFMSRSASTRGL